MKSEHNVQCDLIQELLPLYADEELSKPIQEMVRQHLEECTLCRLELEEYKEPLFKDIDLKDYPGVKMKPFMHLLSSFKSVVWLSLLVIIVGTGSLTIAAYNLGKSVSLQNPIYSRAIKEDLFVQVHKTKKLGPYEITLSRILLDNTQTVLFYNTNPAISEDDGIIITVRDSGERIYETLSGFSYGGKEHVLNLQPVDSNTKELIIEFHLEGTPASETFSVPVDPIPVLASTSKWWPGITREFGPVRVDLESVVLGLTKSEVNIRTLWPLNQQIRGIGFGLMPPQGPVIGEDGRVLSASGSFFRVAGALPDNRYYASLLDTTNRRQIGLNTIGFQTDSISGGVNVTFEFDPIQEPASYMVFTLPDVYLYETVDGTDLEIIIEDGQERLINQNIGNGLQEVIIEKVVKEGQRLQIEYTLPWAEETNYPEYLPEIVLRSPEGFERQGRIISTMNNHGVIEVYPGDESTLTLGLKSLGIMLQGEREYELQIPTGY